jgi:hypothetical protein
MKTEFVPDSKHIVSLLQRPTNYSCSREKSLFIMKYINTLCGQNTELLYINMGGTYHWALKY